MYEVVKWKAFYFEEWGSKVVLLLGTAPVLEKLMMGQSTWLF
jgi:hypothetical protein